MFCKYLGPLISHRNGFVFEIFVQVSVFKRKNRFEYQILGYRDIKQTRSLIFFGTPCNVSKFVLFQISDYSHGMRATLLHVSVIVLGRYYTKMIMVKGEQN